MRRACLVLAATAVGCGAAREHATDEPVAAVEAAAQVDPLIRSALAVEFSDEELERVLALSPLPPPPPDPTNAFADDPRAAKLGRFLFFDTDLSAYGSVSCSTCHDPTKGWSDGRDLGFGIDQLERHSQTLWNVAYNRWFFWDGRADQLWNQALMPLEDAREHGFSRVEVAHRIQRDVELRDAYEAIFGPLPALDDRDRFPPEGRPVPDEPEHPHQVAWSSMSEDDREAIDRVFVNVGKSIAAFERGIVSRRAPFDVFVEGLEEGDPKKLRYMSPLAQEGLQLFVSDRTHCHLCHTGPEFTDREFHNTRVPPLPAIRDYDPGRYEGLETVRSNPFKGTSRFSDAPTGPAELKIDYLVKGGQNWGEFKTPSLRNVQVTAPYMHQGQFAALEDVLRYYSTLEGAIQVHEHTEKILVPQELTDHEIAAIAAFLAALTDETIDPELTGPPSTPGSDTPPG